VTADDGSRGYADWAIDDPSLRQLEDPPEFSWSPSSSGTTWFFDHDRVPEQVEARDERPRAGSDAGRTATPPDDRGTRLAEAASGSNGVPGSAGSLDSTVASDPLGPNDTEDVKFERWINTSSADTLGSTSSRPSAVEDVTNDEHLPVREGHPRLALAHNPLPAIMLGLLFATVFGVVGAVSSFGGQTVYTSTTVMLINDPYQLATSGSSEFLNLDALRSKYAGLLDTDPIAQPVAASLHLSLDGVIGALSSQVPTESLLMSVEATWASPTEAELISQTAANELTSYVNAENTHYAIPANDQISLTTVNPASPAVARRPSKSHALTLAVGLAVLGFALGFFSVQLVRFLR
jgi:capsular polysaccharide biosynthesis protein